MPNSDAGLAEDEVSGAHETGLGPGPRRPAPATARTWGSQRSRSWSKLPTMVRRVIVFVVLVALWQAYVSLLHVNHLLFSSPAAAAAAFVQGWRNGQIGSATATTLEVLFIGMVIGVGLGLVLTVLATLTTLGRDFVMLMTAMLNPLPSIAILPLALIWFGLSNNALIFVIVLAVVWPMAITMSAGFTTINPTLLMAARNLGLSGWRMTAYVLLPAALPYVIGGFKVSWAFAWRTIIAAELVFGTAGGTGGLGYYISNEQYFLKIPNVFAGLISIAIIGIGMDVLLNFIEKRTVVRWGMQRV